MTRTLRVALSVAIGVVFPALVMAQNTAGIVGVVRDSSGAVLPGASVEAASPALIEKVRTAVTDGQGRFNLVELRPGTYTVTFTLAGFASIRREGIELSAGFTASINVDMKVGGLEQTVVVTGQSPVVDVQNVRTQQVLRSEVLEALPSGARDLSQFVGLTLGATNAFRGMNDVGGVQADLATGIMLHGLHDQDTTVSIDGANANIFYGTFSGSDRVYKNNTISVTEAVIDTSGTSAEQRTGGANINMVPRDGGNRFSVHSVLAYGNQDWSAGKVPDNLVARGSVAEANSLKKLYDYGLGIGGPIVRDRLWFYESNRRWGSQAFAANSYFDKSPVFYRYEPDLSRPAYTDSHLWDVGGRFTWQINTKNKLTSDVHYQQSCQCWQSLAIGNFASPEASYSILYGGGHEGQDRRSKAPIPWNTTWTYAPTNRLLIQARFQLFQQGVLFLNPKPVGADDFNIIDVAKGFQWGSVRFPASNGIQTDGDTRSQSASVSYITGSHAFKTGFETMQGSSHKGTQVLPNATSYYFFNGVPLQVLQFQSPREYDNEGGTLGLFAQEQWTINKVTLNLGVRYDHFWARALPANIVAGPWIGARSYPGLDDVPNFKDITHRVGAAYDLFGNGKTAIKGSWGRYLAGLGPADAETFGPVNAVLTDASRFWNDANGNFVPDCNLANFGANGECGAILQPQFGQLLPSTTWPESERIGWNKREYNNQYSLAVQHELFPGLGLQVSYHRTVWKNASAIVNQALTPADYTSYCITSPTDPLLGSVSGSQVCGLYDVNPNKVGQRLLVKMLAKDVPGATAEPAEVYNGVDIALSARFGQGGVLTGGVAIGRTVFDLCWQNNLPQVQQSVVGGGVSAQLPFLPRSDRFCHIEPSWWDGNGSQIKFQVVYPLPGDFVVSGTFKHLPGIPNPATYVYSNAQARASLGRDLSDCRGVVPCTAVGTAELLPTPGARGGAFGGTKFDDRLTQVDLRLARRFTIRGLRIQPAAELYNVFNNRAPQRIVETYGSSWRLPTLLLGGRLFKIGAQVDY